MYFSPLLGSIHRRSLEHPSDSIIYPFFFFFLFCQVNYKKGLLCYGINISTCMHQHPHREYWIKKTFLILMLEANRSSVKSSPRTTELSWGHIAEVGRGPGDHQIWPQLPCSKHRQLELFAEGIAQSGFKYLQGQRLCSTSGLFSQAKYIHAFIAFIY